MRRTTLAVVLVFVVVIGALLRFLAGDDSSQRSVAADFSVSPPVAEPERVAGALDGSTELEAASQAGDLALESEQANARAALVAKAEEPERALTLVRVIQGEQAVPVANAKVFAGRVTKPVARAEDRVVDEPERPEIDRWDGNALDAVVEGAPTLHTDAEGLVEVPTAIGGTTVVVARHGDLWGRLVLDDASEDVGDDSVGEPRELALELDRTLTVRTVDTLGRPMGGVSIRFEAQHWTWQPRREIETDAATGEARFAHVQLDLEANENADGFRVSPAVLTPDPPHHVLDPEDWPTRAILFQLAHGAIVVVEALDPDGQPWTRGGTIFLGIVEEGQTRRVSAFTRHARRTIHRPLFRGRARFPHVALGQELDVAFHPTGMRLPTRIFADGPRSGGEEQHIPIAMGANHPVLRLRLLDVDEAPLRDREVSVIVRNRALRFGGGIGATARTDAAGVLFVSLEEGWTSGSVHVALDEETSGSVEIEQELPVGPSDFGDLILGPTPLIVSGRVFGRGGEPLAEADIELSEWSGEDDWNRLWSQDTETDATGTFELRGAFGAQRGRIAARREGYTGEPVEFLPGTSGLVVELSAAGAIVGSFLLDEDLPADELQVRLEPAGEDPVELDWRLRRADLEPDGTFRCAPLPAGTYDVSLRSGRSQILYEAPGIEVGVGHDTRDPALDAVDLRGELHGLQLTIVAPDAAESNRGVVRYGPAGAEELEDSHWFHGDEVVLITRHRTIDVDLEVPGCRMARLRGISGDERVVLERGFPVRIFLVGDGEPLAAPYGLSVGLTSAEDDGRAVGFDAPRFDEEREILVYAMRAGPMKVDWIVEKAVAGAASATTVDADPEQIVYVSESDREQRIEVHLTKEEAERLVEALNR